MAVFDDMRPALLNLKGFSPSPEYSVQTGEVLRCDDHIRGHCVTPERTLKHEKDKDHQIQPG